MFLLQVAPPSLEHEVADPLGAAGAEIEPGTAHFPFRSRGHGVQPLGGGGGLVVDRTGLDHVWPRSVERKATRSPSPPLNLLPMAVTQTVPLAAATRGPRRMPSDIDLIGGSSEGLEKCWPLSVDRQ